MAKAAPVRRPIPSQRSIRDNNPNRRHRWGHLYPVRDKCRSHRTTFLPSLNPRAHINKGSLPRLVRSDNTIIPPRTHRLPNLPHLLSLDTQAIPFTTHNRHIGIHCKKYNNFKTNKSTSSGSNNITSNNNNNKHNNKHNSKHNSKRNNSNSSNNHVHLLPHKHHNIQRISLVNSHIRYLLSNLTPTPHSNNSNRYPMMSEEEA